VTRRTCFVVKKPFLAARASSQRVGVSIKCVILS
jgi:hypothetical protein